MITEQLTQNKVEGMESVEVNGRENGIADKNDRPLLVSEATDDELWAELERRGWIPV